MEIIWFEIVVPKLATILSHNGYPMPTAVLMPVSIWFIVIMLKFAAHTSKISLMYVHDYSFFLTRVQTRVL